MTGLILAMARGAGEVAPLMVTGVVKLAPSLPIDGEGPFIHLERKFMHLGFHIYDVGFQSPDSDAAQPMVFATTLLLILLVVAMNLTAILIRNRLRKNTRPPASNPILLHHPMTEPAAANDEPIIEVEDFSFFYGSKQVLFNIGMTFETNRVTALIGPSGCGKSTLLRNINRMNDLVPDVRHQGDIRIDGTSLYDPRVEVISLRKRVGMVFQKYNPFPKSIYENIVFPLRVAGRNRRAELDETVERSLKGAALWDEVKDKLHESAYGLSGGQQQRLCIARAIANRPQILLMDEPCAALDPIATLKIEDLMEDLKKELTIVIVTHNMQQATRIADRTAFMYMGRLVEYGETSQIFTNPTEKETEAYITGRFS